MGEGLSISAKSDDTEFRYWICVQWTAAEFRAWAMNEDGAILMRLRSARGLARVVADELQDVLADLLKPWLQRDATPVLVSGLPPHDAGAIDCLPVPGRPAARAELGHFASDPKVSLYVLPSLRQDTPPDCLCAEGTILRGLLACQPEFDGVVCIPGEMTRWVRVEAGEVRGVQSHMTGELVTLLSQSSSLADHLAGEPAAGSDFAETVDRVLQEPGTLLCHLSGLRTRAMLGRAPASVEQLAGCLIGADLADARGVWTDRAVIVVDDAAIASLYVRALAGQGCDARLRDPEELTLAGFRQLYAELGCRAG